VRGRVYATATTEFGPWCDVEWRARLAIASELVGVAHRIVDLAAAQVSTRRQFGRPIASNQAVRFRLAEAYVEMVGAQALIAAAWQDRSPAAARWAKAAAGSAHDAVAKHAMQVCGAIGLSEEHPLPRLVRRGMALDALLGSASSQQLQIGKELFAQQRNTESSEKARCLAVGRF
jgi:alkylation response protein AidB-like acyl-CoA dehydrogenase